MSRPLQLLAVSLPAGSGPASRLLAEVDRIEAGGQVRVLDMLLVGKDRDGVVAKLSVGEDEDFGSLVAQLFPLGDVAAGGAGAQDELWAWADVYSKKYVVGDPFGLTVPFSVPPVSATPEAVPVVATGATGGAADVTRTPVTFCLSRVKFQSCLPLLKPDWVGSALTRTAVMRP